MRILAKLPRQRRAVESGHHEIEQDHARRRPTSQAVQRIETVDGEHDTTAEALEELADYLPDVRLVIHDEDATTACHKRNSLDSCQERVDSPTRPSRVVILRLGLGFLIQGKDGRLSVSS
jgi:hypothetical protein